MRFYDINVMRMAYYLVRWRNIAISNNVGTVKHSLSARLHALREERHFALGDGFALSNLGSL